VIRPIRKKKAEASRPISWKRALTGWPQENTQGNLVRVYGIRAACCEDRRESPKMALADSTCSAANVSGVARRGNPASDGKDNIVIPASEREQNASISTFVQFGINNSETLPVKEYLGLGFTGFGLVPHRPGDSIGVGMAWSWLNPNLFDRPSELMFQGYYQARLFTGAFFQPAVSYIPTPGANPKLDSAWALTFRFTCLF